MKMGDPLNVVPNGKAHVALHDLPMPDIEKHAHARGVHPLAHFQGPLGAVALLIRIIDAVDGLETDRHASVFSLSLHAVQKNHAGVDALLVREASPVSRYGNQVRAIVGSALVNRGSHGLFDSRVLISLVETVLDADAHVRRGHGANEAVLLERRPVLGAHQVKPIAAQTCGLAAHVLKGHSLGKDASGERLLEAPLSVSRAGCLSSRNAGRCCGSEEFATSHTANFSILLDE
jgi:hypothetical protein